MVTTSRVCQDTRACKSEALVISSLKRSAAVSSNIKVLSTAYLRKFATRYQKKTKDYCYCKTSQDIFSHSLHSKGIFLFVMIILSASNFLVNFLWQKSLQMQDTENT